MPAPEKTTKSEKRRRAVATCRERGIVIPTFAQMRDPDSIDPVITA